MKYLICWEETFYALTDPRTNEVRYIGRTCNLEQRYLNHCNPTYNDLTPKSVWLREIKTLGFRPGCIELETIPFTYTQTTGPLMHAKDIERFWIEYFKMLGANLTNMVHYRHIQQPAKRIRKKAA